MPVSVIFSAAPTLCVTPLYHFSSDVSELIVDTNFRVCRFDDCRAVAFDDLVAKHFRVHEPDYLVCHVPFVSVEEPLLEAFKLSLSNESRVFEERVAEAANLVLARTEEFFRVLRLFKPGRVRPGETFFLFRELSWDQRGSVTASPIWQAASYGHVSAATVDYTQLSIASLTKTPYVLNSTEVPFLRAFRDLLVPALKNISSSAVIATALRLYGADNGEESDVVGAVTALEALLTKKEETEGLTYRLSMRIANLLGQDAGSRRSIFRDVKSFYNLRSKIVHGVELDTKLLSRMNEVDSLRETVRRVLLSVMALFSEGAARPTDLPDLLDELAFDDEKRNQVQATASKFLHIDAKNAVS